MSKSDQSFIGHLWSLGVRDGNRLYFSGAMLLACLMHTLRRVVSRFLKIWSVGSENNTKDHNLKKGIMARA